MKWIYHKKKALTKEQCEKYILSFEDENKQKIKGPDPLKLNSHFYDRISLNVDKCSFESVLSESLKEYTKLHPFLMKYDRWDYDKIANFQRYQPGQSYSEEHCEFFNHTEAYKRILVWMFYLNDIKDGGGTRFPQQDFTTKVECGDLYIWPAHFTHTHYGLPAKNELKYIITGWCSFI